jgi:hypothetical protein
MGRSILYTSVARLLRSDVGVAFNNINSGTDGG